MNCHLSVDRPEMHCLTLKLKNLPEVNQFHIISDRSAPGQYDPSSLLHVSSCMLLL